MKEPTRGQEFEEKLQRIAAPAPNPRARARAKDAALAEFERVQTAANESIGPRRAGFFERLAAWLMGREAGATRPGWRPRAALLGGVASVFVAVFGLMSIWPMVTGRQAIPSLEDSRQSRAIPRPAPASAPNIANERSVQEDVVAAAPHGGLSAQDVAMPLARMAAPLGIDAEPRGPASATAPQSAADAHQRGDVAHAQVEKSSDPAVVARFRANAPSAPEASGASANLGVGGSAQEAKREADVVDAIRSEDLGELPDTNVAESLRRRPAVSVTRSLSNFTDTNPVRRTADARVSSFSVDVDTTSYRAVRTRLNSGVLPPKESVRIEELINYFDYSWPLPESREQPFKPTVIVSDSPWDRGKKLVHIGIKGFQLEAQRRPDANVVMLVDISDSMDDVERLPLVKESMRLMLSSLKATDTVAIVVYSSTTGVVLEPTPVSERQKIWQALENLQPIATAAPGTSGIKLAYDVAAKNFLPNGINRVLLCTDNDFNAGIGGALTLRKLVEREREQGIFLSILGFGMGEYRDERALALAQQGNGVAANVEDVQDARRVLVEQATGTLFTIAKDVRIQVEFNPATVAEWRLVGYEARELKGGGFNDDNVNAGDVGSGHTATAIYEITPASAQTAPDEGRYAPPVSARPGHGAHEYGYLKIRYKLPGGFRSRVIEQPIEIAPLRLTDTLRRDLEFSTAVAGFAQLLRGGRYTGSLTYDDVVRQAEAARGEDPLGYRAEFVQLVREAQRAGRNR